MITYFEFTGQNDKHMFPVPKMEAVTFQIRIKIYSHSFFAYRVTVNDAEWKQTATFIFKVIHYVHLHVYVHRFLHQLSAQS